MQLSVISPLLLHLHASFIVHMMRALIRLGHGHPSLCQTYSGFGINEPIAEHVADCTHLMKSSTCKQKCTFPAHTIRHPSLIVQQWRWIGRAHEYMLYITPC